MIRSNKNPGQPLRRLLSAAAAVALVFWISAATSSPQEPKAPPAEGVSFEVASIKQYKPGQSTRAPIPSISLADGAENEYVKNGLLSVTASPPLLLLFAYKLTPRQEQFVYSELPNWAKAQPFEIEARGPNYVTRAQLRLMMQSLLADRFKLSAHMQDRTGPVFSLVLEKKGKTGPNLQRHSEKAQQCHLADLSAVEAYGPQQHAPRCGELLMQYPRPPETSARVFAYAITMQQFAEALPGQPGISLELNRPIVDRTNLIGEFDLEFSYQPPNGNTPSDPSMPSLLEGLSGQLGLKLERSTGVVKDLIVDHIEEPTPN